MLIGKKTIKRCDTSPPHLTMLLMRYLAKLERRALHLFTRTLYVDMTTDTYNTFTWSLMNHSFMRKTTDVQQILYYTKN